MVRVFDVFRHFQQFFSYRYIVTTRFKGGEKSEQL